MRKLKDNIFQIRSSDEWLEKLEQLSKICGLTKSEYIRLLIESEYKKIEIYKKIPKSS
jgi:predicted DNA-binding protein